MTSSTVDFPPTPGLEKRAPSGPSTLSQKPNRPRKNFGRGLISVVLIVLVIAVCASVSRMFLMLYQPPTRGEAVSRIHAVQTYQTEQYDVQELISGFGTARAMQQVILSAQVSGEVIETMEPLKVGQFVSASRLVTRPDGTQQQQPGDVIARIDTKTYQERFQQAEDLLQQDLAELSRLAEEDRNLRRRLQIQQRSLTEFQKEYERVRGLVERGVLSQSNLTTSELDLQRYEDAKVQLETEVNLIPPRMKQVEARLATHKNDLEIARINLDRTNIISPISGQFSEVHVERGQYVKVGDPLVTITNAQRVEIPVGIPLHDYLKIIPQIQQGDYPQASLQTRHNDSFNWTGLVTRAAPVVDPQTRTVEVYVVVDNAGSPHPLLPGTFVTLAIDGPIHENVIPIPRDTIYQQQVFVVEENLVTARQIDPVAIIESNVLLRESLQAGEQIVMTNLDVLRSGDAVRVVGERNHHFLSEQKRSKFPTLRVLNATP